MYYIITYNPCSLRSVTLTAHASDLLLGVWGGALKIEKHRADFNPNQTASQPKVRFHIRPTVNPLGLPLAFVVP